jgi:CyaY protein
MTDSEFQEQVIATLEHIEAALDASGVDLDFERKGDTVLEIEFGDGGRVIVNGHAAAQEIWLAAKSGGQHFRLERNAWVNTRDGGDFYAALSKAVSEQAGEQVTLRAA